MRAIAIAYCALMLSTPADAYTLHWTCGKSHVQLWIDKHNDEYKPEDFDEAGNLRPQVKAVPWSYVIDIQPPPDGDLRFELKGETAKLGGRRCWGFEKRY